MRILITGSRDWTDTEAIRGALREAWHQLGRPRDAILVHGECQSGADKIAASWWWAWGLPVEGHPADWSKGRKAGPERNAAMVNLGADVCLAFIANCSSPRCKRAGTHPSHGASGCAALAEKAGIPTRRFYS